MVNGRSSFYGDVNVYGGSVTAVNGIFTGVSVSGISSFSDEMMLIGGYLNFNDE